MVVHIDPAATSILPELLTRAGNLPARHPEQGAPLEHSNIYVAPPDLHMRVMRNTRESIVLDRGPRESRHRPSLDALFRSAAYAFGPRVIGVVLTGGRDDGTTGLLAIKRAGGVTIVQDPADAAFPEMPRNAVESVQPDHVVPLVQIASLLVRLVNTAPAVKESAAMNNQQDIYHTGSPSIWSCPDCGGVLWELEDGNLRFACRVGHTYSSAAMLEGQSEAVESALWASVRLLEENAAMYRRLADRASDRGHAGEARRLQENAEDKQRHADLLRKMILGNAPLRATTAGA